jgi:hypothetical protein
MSYTRGMLVVRRAGVLAVPQCPGRPAGMEKTMTVTGSPGVPGDTREFLASVHAEESPAEYARRMSDRADREAERAEAQRRAAVEEEREQYLMRAQLAGLHGRSHADIVAEAMRAGDEDAEYEGARKTIEKIDRRRAARAEQERSRARLLDAVTSRRARVLDPVEQALERARIAADDAARAQRETIERARAQVRSRKLATEPSIGVKPDGTPYYRESRGLHHR